MAQEFKEFTRSRQIKTVDERLRVVFLDLSLDLSFREVATNMTRRDERITDEAIRKRPKACQPWVKALLLETLPKRKLDGIPSGFRFYAFDGISNQAPGATGTDYRHRNGLDLVTLEFTHLLVTDKHTYEHLKNYPFRYGDVAVVVRGLCHATGILEKQSGGADVIVRYHQAVMHRNKNDGTPLNIVNHLKDNPNFTQITLAVSAKVNSRNNKKNGFSSDHLTQLNGNLIV